MKKMTKHPFVWLWCMLLFLPFLVASPSNAQCTMTSGGIDAAMASCGADELDCFVALAKNNLSCAPNIAWYYMIMYAPKNPKAVEFSFLNKLPYSHSLSESVSGAIGLAVIANENQQKAGSTTSANEYPFGQGSRSADEQPYGK